MSDPEIGRVEPRLADDHRPAEWRPFEPEPDAAAEPAVEPSGSGAGDDPDALLLGVLHDVRDLLSRLVGRLEQLDRSIAAMPGPGAAIGPLDAKVNELGGALGSIATMLESIETAVHAGVGPGPGPGAGLVERVAAAGGAAGTNALLHARIEAIEQHVETTAAEIGRLKAQLDFIEEGIGYLATGLLGGGTPP